MISPITCSWVIQWNYRPIFAQNSTYVRAFFPITMRTSIRKIVKVVRTAMLLADDVLDVKREVCNHIRFKAIFTTEIGSKCNKLACSGGKLFAHFEATDNLLSARALAKLTTCSTIINCSISVFSTSFNPSGILFFNNKSSNRSWAFGEV